MLTFAQFIIEDVSFTPDSDDPTERKGWMSPRGEAHYFNPNDHHAFNPHPTIKKTIDKITHNASTKCKDRSPEGRDAILQSQRRGLARFGKKGDTFFAHYDHNSPGGTQAALHALRDLHPAKGERIVINHKPWTHTGSKSANDKEFRSASEAAAHIRKMHPHRLDESKHEETYAWYDHPYHGIMIKKHEGNNGAHHILAARHHFEIDSAPRGALHVNTKKKSTHMVHYPNTPKPVTRDLESVLRQKLNIPQNYKPTPKAYD